MTLLEKLFQAKKEIGKISKDSTNPFFKSKYFDINGLLEHVEPILQKHDLLLLQPILKGHVITRIYSIEDGEYLDSSIELTDIKDPQKKGSEITYYRRYTLTSLLGLQAEDDDGNSATKQVKVESKPKLNSFQFQAAKKGTKEQIQNVLNTFTITKTEREELTKLLK